jgi:hypothetical protein
MKIRGFLLILSLMFICYLGKNMREGLHDEIEKNDVFKKQTKYSRHTERQKRCLNKIFNNKMGDKRPSRRPTKNPRHCRNKNNKHKHNRYNKCKHLLPGHKKSKDSNKYFFNKDNYILKTKMVPPVSPKGPYIKVINKDNKRHDDDEGGGKHDNNKHDDINNKDASKNNSDSCKACANCKNGLGFTCDKGGNYSFANMNHVPPPLTANVPPPLTANVPPPMTAPVGKYAPLPMLSSFSAFGR